MEAEDERRFRSIKECDDLMRKQNFPGTAVRLAARRLAAARVELEDLSVQERDAKRLVPWDGVEIRKRSRDLRKEYLSPVAKAAKAIDGFVRDTPGAAKALRMPHPKDSVALHVEAGDRFAKFLKEHLTSFLKESGFDRNFLSKLRAATDELRKQSQFAHSTRGERSRLLREIKSQLKKGRAQIDLLKVLLEPLLIERQLETMWALASRVGAKIGRPRYTPEERARKTIENAARKVERREQRRQKKEQLRLARRAKRLQKKEALKQERPRRARRATPLSPAGEPGAEAPPSVTASPPSAAASPSSVAASP